VGQVLAAGFLKHGHPAMLGTRDPKKPDVQKWVAETMGSKAGTFAETAKFGELIVLATAGKVAENAVELAGVANLAGKTIIDACNPIADAPPVNGVLKFFTTLDDSLMERLQKQAPKARFVKAFNSVGSALMVNPKLPAKPTMFICGNDDAAKKTVAGILEQFGWDAEDTGKAESARALEPLCMLWCIPGFLKNDWAHAFKLLR
jgi:predicted dinucleotide-binding enzyme